MTADKAKINTSHMKGKIGAIQAFPRQGVLERGERKDKPNRCP